MKVRYKEIN